MRSTSIFNYVWGRFDPAARSFAIVRIGLVAVAIGVIANASGRPLLVRPSSAPGHQYGHGGRCDFGRGAGGISAGAAIARQCDGSPNKRATVSAVASPGTDFGIVAIRRSFPAGHSERNERLADSREASRLCQTLSRLLTQRVSRRRREAPRLRRRVPQVPR